MRLAFFSGEGLFRLFILISMYAITPGITAQVILCDGNLGDNIFTEGNFGSASPIVVQSNPGLAPGFIYTTRVPPIDGEYTLTNNMAAWANGYDTWLRIGDNSPGPNGYMMVVNASYTPGIFYEKIVDDLCENTVYEFSADVINLIRKGTTGHILPNVSFFIDDVLAYSSGTIAQDEKWHTYGFTFITNPGQSVVKLTLRNNAPGGIGNDLALDNISFKACGPSSSASISPAGKICENSLFPLLTANIDADTGAIQWQLSIGDEQQWNDIPGAVDRTHQVAQLTAGKYYFRYLYSNTATNIFNPKCRIVSDGILIEIVPVEFQIRDTICDGMTYILGDTLYVETGIYQQLLTASNGCDSLVTLDLVVVPDPPIVVHYDVSPPSCQGATDGTLSIASVSGVIPPYDFFIGGNLIPPPVSSIPMPSGTYSARIENKYGCFDETEVTIPEGPLFSIVTVSDTMIRLGHSVLLNTQSSLPEASASWTPAIHLSCPACLSTQAMPVYDQSYIVEAMTEGGCTARDTITIRVDRTAVYYVPNVFTPNGDQVNDDFTFSPDPLTITAVTEVLIFDRWGGIVSQKSSLPSEYIMVLWDGETKHGPAPAGTYVYAITYSLADESKQHIRGDVTLIR